MGTDLDTYYNRLNYFFRENAKAPLAAEDQLVMLHLLQRNNQTSNVGSFYLTDARLIELTQLTKSQVTEAKRHLKNLGFIDFHVNPSAPRAGTMYTLPPLPKQVQPPPGQYRSVNSDEVKKAWRECAGENLTGGAAFGMIELENTYGTKKVVAAIIKADQSNTAPRLTFNYVKAILENTRGDSKRVGDYRNTNARATRTAGRPVGRDDEFDTDLPPQYRQYQ